MRIAILILLIISAGGYHNSEAFSSDACEPFEDKLEQIESYIERSLWSFAERDSKKILEEEPDCFLARVYLGKIPYYRGEDDQALSYFEELAEVDSTRHHPYHYRGLIFHENGRHFDALVEFIKAFESNPQLGTGYYINTIAPLMTDRNRFITQRIDSVASVKPDLSSLHVGKGLFYYINENYREAVEHFKEAVNINRENAGGWYFAGRCYDLLDEVSLALNAYNQAIALREDYRSAYYFRGLKRINTGDWRRGCNDLRRASEYEHVAAEDAIYHHCRVRYY